MAEDNVTELHPIQSKDTPSKDEIGLGILRFWWWATSRAAVGPVLVMHTAGMLHLDLDRNIPNLNYIQSMAVTFALLVLGFFVRR